MAAAHCCCNGSCLHSVAKNTQKLPAVLRASRLLARPQSGSTCKSRAGCPTSAPPRVQRPLHSTRSQLKPAGCQLGHCRPLFLQCVLGGAHRARRADSVHGHGLQSSSAFCVCSSLLLLLLLLLHSNPG